MLLKKLLLFCMLSFLTFSSFAEEEVQVQKVNINTADAEELQTLLNGVGPQKAAAIVEFREKNGLFKTPADLMNVKGIGEKTFEKNKDIIIVSSETVESDAQLIECEAESDSDSNTEKQSVDKTDKTDKVAGTESTKDKDVEKQAVEKSICKKPESTKDSSDSSTSPKATDGNELDSSEEHPDRTGQGTH